MATKPTQKSTTAPTADRQPDPDIPHLVILDSPEDIGSPEQQPPQEQPAHPTQEQPPKQSDPDNTPHGTTPQQTIPTRPAKKPKNPLYTALKLPTQIGSKLNLLINPKTKLVCGYLHQKEHSNSHPNSKYFTRVPTSSFDGGIVCDTRTGTPMVYQDPSSYQVYPQVKGPTPRSWDTFLSHLAEACDLVGLFSYQGGYAFMNQSTRKVMIISNTNAFSSFIRARIRIWDYNEDNKITLVSLPKDDESRIYHSSDFSGKLQKIARINKVSLPRFDKNKKVVWPEDGYDPDTQTMTCQEIKPSPFLENHPDSAMEYLSRIFSEFQFLKKEVDFPAALCQMLSTYCADLLVSHDQEGNRVEAISPLIATTANDSNAGKTLILQLMSQPAYGTFPMTTLPSNEHHRRQELLTAIKDGRQGIILDETRSTVSNVLLTLITSDFSGRLLGANESITGRLKVAMAGPQMELDGQTSRRTIMCKMFTLTGAQGRAIKRPMDTSTHHLVRPYLLAAAKVMVKRWVSKGCPEHKLDQRTDWPVFAKIIGGILEANGFTVPFYERSGPVLLTASDPQAALFEFVRGMDNGTFSWPGKEPFPDTGIGTQMLLDTMKSLGYCEHITPDHKGATAFGKQMSSFANIARPIEGYLLKNKRMNSGMIWWFTPTNDPRNEPRSVIKRSKQDGRLERE